MKTKLALFFLLVTMASWAQTNAVHNWTLKSGAVFPGDYYTSGTLTVVIKSHGTNCLLKISELSTKDWLYFQDCKAAQRQRLLDAEAAQMRAAGKVEFTVQVIENFPEKAVNQYGWMDCKFDGLDDIYVDFKEDQLGFDIRDANGDFFARCCAFKTNPHTNEADPVIAKLMTLKKGDKVRLFGIVMRGHLDNNLYVSDFEMIESAADAAAVKKVNQDLENSGLPK